MEPKKILIIEDEVSIAELERDYLELSGFLVLTETDGTAGLHRALNEPVDLVVLEVSINIIRMIQRRKRNKQVLLFQKLFLYSKMNGPCMIWISTQQSNLLLPTLVGITT